MLLNTNISIAYKNYNGNYNVLDMSIFQIDRINIKFTSICMERFDKEIALSIKCPVCGKYHYYRYSINEFFQKSIIAGGCESLGIPLFFIGNSIKVNNKVRKYNDIDKSIYAMI